MTTRPIYYDTETTGINVNVDKIVEIAAFDPVNDKTFSELVNPKISIPVEASLIHNITDEMVANSDGFDKVSKKFVDFCSGDCILIAHNNDRFDQPLLLNEFERNSIPDPKFRFLDTLKWARRYRPDLPKHSLQYLREIYEIQANNAHRALDDVIILHSVFNKMIGDLDIEKVYSLLNSFRKIKKMPFGKHQGKTLSDVPQDYVAWLSKSGAFEKEENKELHLSFVELGILQ